MRLGGKETDEPRYDQATLKKVAGLASRLQNQHRETISAAEIEAVGIEVGLDRTFIREALTQVTSRQPRSEIERATRIEFYSYVAALGGPLLWATLAFIGASLGSGAWQTFATQIAPAPLAGLLGFLAGRRNIAALSGAIMAAALAPVAGLHPDGGTAAGVVAGYAAVGMPVLGLISRFGATMREHYFPLLSDRKSVSRAALVEFVFSLQNQLEGRKQRRAFLSVDVVGSAEMKIGAAELAVEHSFAQFRAWVEEVVHAAGGEIHSAAGDGMMAIFREDTAAVRAARSLQEGMARFNTERNRLSRPFRVRCGLSAGDLALEEGAPLGHLNSAIVDRAAVLQKHAPPGGIVVGGEMAGAALLELGDLRPLPNPSGDEAAFAWNGGPRVSIAPAAVATEDVQTVGRA
jgi:class 3 adenylate cyclase